MSLYGFDPMGSVSSYTSAPDEEGEWVGASVVLVERTEDETTVHEVLWTDSDDQSILSSDNSGITILPSATSSQALISPEQPTMFRGMSPQPPRYTPYILSIATVPSDSSSLSLHARSLPSSISLGSLQSQSLASTALVTLGSIVEDRRNSTLPGVDDVDTTSRAIIRIPPTTTTTTNHAPRSWIEALQCEDDWEELCGRMYEILRVLDEPITDEVLAYLIQQEEELVWTQTKRSERWSADAALWALSAVVPLVTAALWNRR